VENAPDNLENQSGRLVHRGKPIEHRGNKPPSSRKPDSEFLGMELGYMSLQYLFERVKLAFGYYKTLIIQSTVV
jgi:hypothetical protein